MGKDKHIICTTEQLEDFLQQRNNIILEELKSILQQNDKNTDNKITSLKSEVESTLKLREKELRRLRRETEESFRTCERLLHALTFQRKMLEAVLKIRDREIQNLRRCVGLQKRLLIKTLSVVVGDGVLEMSPKQRGDLLKLVQEMGDIEINSSEVVGYCEETVFQDYREALVKTDSAANTANIDNIIHVRRAERAAKGSGEGASFMRGVFTPRTTVPDREDSDESSDELYLPADIAPHNIPVSKSQPIQAKDVETLFGSLSDEKRNTEVSKQVLFQCGTLLGPAWVSFAVSQRIGFLLEDVSVLRKRYASEAERAKAMLLIWLEQSGEGTYGNLVVALNDIGRRDIAQNIISMA